MKIAVEGCAHGELEKIYETIEHLEKQNNVKIDLLICCGDFQATRNLDDLQCMAVPPKFRDICTFYKYYSGEKMAPILTLFIGGNHEASNYLQELPYGGWVAPNIYYMGYAGVVNVGGLRIGGLSGIFKGKDFYKGRYEKPPYNGDTMRSCYHIRAIDIFRLKQISNHVDIMISHDWPTGVYNHGDVPGLLRRKPFFKEEIETETLGSKPAAELLDHIKPAYWFSAHLHCKFAAIIPHENEPIKKTTKFLALDKCLPKRQFLQVVNIDSGDSEVKLAYDLEWLTILHLTNHLVSIKRVNTYLPGPGGDTRWKFTPTSEEIDHVRGRFPNGLTIAQRFMRTAPAYDPNGSNVTSRPHPVVNPQTTELCELLGIDDPLALLIAEDPTASDSSFNLSAASNFDGSSFIASTDSEPDSLVGPSPIKPRPRMSLHTPSPLKLPPPTPSPVNLPSFRTPLKLPEPNLTENPLSSTPYGKSDIETPNPTPPSPSEIPKPNFSPAGHEDLGNGGASGDQEEQGSGPKKFRRRNFAMYASNNDDDE